VEHQVVDLLASNPCVRNKCAAEELGGAFTTAQGAIERLEKLEVLRKVS